MFGLDVVTGRDNEYMGKTKLTYKLIDTMAELKAQGMANKDICAAVGISETTLYRWLGDQTTRMQRVLSERIKKGEAEYKAELLNTIRGAALAKHMNWTAAAWLLERKYPDEFSLNRRSVDENSQAAPVIVLGVNVAAAKSDKGLSLNDGNVGNVGNNVNSSNA